MNTENPKKQIVLFILLALIFALIFTSLGYYLGRLDNGPAMLFGI